MPLTRFLRTETALILAALSTAFVLAFDEALFAQIGAAWQAALLFAWLFGVMLAAAFGVVHHAEALAHKYGEPYGTLILTISVIGIEVIMIATMMLTGEPAPTLARDTMYSVIMIVINGLIGLSLIVGGLKHGEQRYNLKSSNAYFSMLLALVALGLVMPIVLPAEQLGGYTIFLIVSSVFLYAVFLRVQTREHRYFFVQEDGSATQDSHDAPSAKKINGTYHAVLLLVTLVLVVFLAKSLAVVLDYGIARTGLPLELAALVVAVLILSPEGLAAVRAGRNNEMQRVVNICLGSALATIAMTIPVVLIIAAVFGQTIVLALTPVQAILLVATLLVGMESYRHGQTNMLQGVIHFVLFAAYIALIFFGGGEAPGASAAR